MNNINVLTASGNTVQIIAAVDEEIYGEDMPLVEFIQAVVFDKVQERSDSLKPGQYTVRMLLTIVGEEDD